MRTGSDENGGIPVAVRGGALGDFILTLPALEMLGCGVIVVGTMPHARLALHCGPRAGTRFAAAVHDLGSSRLAGFFARDGELDAEFSGIFAGRKVVSWLRDEDGIFAENVVRAGGIPVNVATDLGGLEHASAQLAARLPGALPPPRVVHFDDESREGALRLLAARGVSGPFVVIHPGSGSARKNVPLPRWAELGRRLAADARVVITGGDADADLPEQLAAAVPGSVVLRDTPLPALGAVLATAEGYFGGDTGVSHLAAAAGAKCRVFFGPTSPTVWAPRGPFVEVEQFSV